MNGNDVISYFPSDADSVNASMFSHLLLRFLKLKNALFLMVLYIYVPLIWPIIYSAEKKDRRFWLKQKQRQRLIAPKSLLLVYMDVLKVYCNFAVNS